MYVTGVLNYRRNMNEFVVNEGGGGVKETSRVQSDSIAHATGQGCSALHLPMLTGPVHNIITIVKVLIRWT